MIKIFLMMLLLSLVGCGPGTTTGNPVAPVNVQVRLEDKQPFAWIQKTWDLIIPPAHAAISNLKMCFKILKFKPDSTTDGANYELKVGQVDINPSGTNLLTVAIPPGTYQQIDFELDKDCDEVIGKPSVSFMNNNGAFFTDESMTIKFQGSYTVSETGTLTLNIDQLLDTIETVTANNQIKINLESAIGDY